MDKWEKSQRDRQQRHHRENPSFSSSLLDAIYRSIDETEEKEEENQLVLYRETMKKKMMMQKQSNFIFFNDDNNDHEDNESKAPTFLRSRNVENWMEKRVCEKVVIQRNSLHSSSSSSDSSSNGGFSSSDSSSELFINGVQRPKPIKTSVIPSQNPTFDSLKGYKSQSTHTQKPKNEINNGFEKKTTKFKALKKVKQPISPGAKLASFLNSLFNSGSGNKNTTKKKAKLVSLSSNTTNTTTTTPCSSASSFSRSCLSKTPSSSRSGGNNNNNNKVNRSVRFCPVSVIVDEDCRPCGHKNLLQEKEEHKKSYGYGCNNEELRLHVMKESKRVEEIARDLLKNYQRNNNKDLEMMMHCEEEDDDDGVSSCSSSDLFELDNLSAIGNIGRYREELPVYETTHFNTNRAIANGFVM